MSLRTMRRHARIPFPNGAAVQSIESRKLLSAALEPPRFLVNDVDPSPVLNAEADPRIAVGASGYLAVWTDRRSVLGTERAAPLNYGWPGAGTDNDIFGAVLDASGRMVGNSFAIYMGGRSDSAPQVEFNGTNFLVTWMSVPEDDQYGKSIIGARVTPAGVVLDPTPILIDASVSGGAVSIAYNWEIAHDTSGNWLAVYGGWMDVTNSVMGRRISPAGALIDASTVQLVSGDSIADSAFFHDGRYIVTSHPASNTQIRRFTPALSFVSQSTIARNGKVASNGNDMYITWVDYSSLPSWDMAAFGSRVSDAGVLLDGAVQLTGGHEYSPSARVTWDGANWQVMTLRASHSILVTHVSPTGAVLNPGGTLLLESPQNLVQFEVAARAGTTVGVFLDRSVGNGDISSAALRADNGVTAREFISKASRNQMNVDLAEGPGGFVAVYKDLDTFGYRILAQRLDSAGRALNAPVVIGQYDNYATSPQIAFNGEVYMVVWYGYQSPTGAGVYMRRLDAAGQPIDSSPRYITNQYAPDIAAVGGTFLVASHYNYYSYSGYTQWRKFDSAGTQIASAYFNYYGGVVLRQLQVLAVNDRWAILTQTHGSYNDQYSGLNFAFIDQAGSQTPTISVGNVVSYAPHIATSGNNVLMVYDQKTDGSYQDVWGRIIGLDSSVGAPFKIGVNGTANSSQSEAHVAWNGSEYIAAWVDHRNKQYPHQPEGDIYATRITEAGVVLDPDGVPVAASSAPDDAPTVHFGHGITLLTYSTFNPAVTAGSMRVAAREVFSPLRLERGMYRYDVDPAIELDLNADVSGTASNTDFVLRNTRTNQTIASADLRLNFDTWRDTIDVAYAPGGQAPAALPDGSYRLTLPAGTVSSARGVTLATDLTIDFSVLAGDANRDDAVNFDDLLRLASNYNTTGKTFSQGDFDYDADIDFDDLLILASRYNRVAGGSLSVLLPPTEPEPHPGLAADILA
jgi:hypothetical protein